MTTQEVIALAKEKLGKEITEQEAQDYIDGKAAIPDETLDLVSDGYCDVPLRLCAECQQPLTYGGIYTSPYCNNPTCSRYRLNA